MTWFASRILIQFKCWTAPKWQSARDNRFPAGQQNWVFSTILSWAIMLLSSLRDMDLIHSINEKIPRSQSINVATPVTVSRYSHLCNELLRRTACLNSGDISSAIYATNCAPELFHCINTLKGWFLVISMTNPKTETRELVFVRETILS